VIRFERNTTTEKTKKNTVMAFWFMTLRSDVGGHQRFGWMQCLHLQ